MSSATDPSFGQGDQQANNEAFGVIDASNGMPSGYGGTPQLQEGINRGMNTYSGGDPNRPVNYSNDTLNKYNSSAPWTGAGGQGYYDPSNNQTYSYQNAPAGSMRLDRPGIDSRLQGNLENPYAGYYGGAPGVAQSEEGRYAGLAESARNTPGAQINNGQYNADRGLELGARGNQDYALGQYQNLINGTGTSVAQQQMNQGLARSMAQQQAIQASARGGGANLVAAQQASANAAAGLSGQANSQAAMLRAQEVQGALAGYSSLASQQRAADLQRQGLSAEQAYRQAQIEEQQRGINSAASLGYEGMRQNVFNTQQQGMEYNESENQNAYMGGAGLGAQQSAQDQQTRNAAIQGGTAAGSALLGYLTYGASNTKIPDNTSSDIRGKKDIGDGAPAVRQQMAAMSPQTFAYKNPSAPGAGPGQRVGVMAQDMERGPYGGQLVKNTPTGKQIDGPGGLSLALASGADHEQRLRQLEQAAMGAHGKSAREHAYSAYEAEKMRGAAPSAPGAGLAAAAMYNARQQNARPFNNFVPQSAITTPQPPPAYPTAPAGLAGIARGY